MNLRRLGEWYPSDVAEAAGLGVFEILPERAAPATIGRTRFLRACGWNSTAQVEKDDTHHESTSFCGIRLQKASKAAIFLALPRGGFAARLDDLSIRYDFGVAGRAGPYALESRQPSQVGNQAALRVEAKRRRCF